MPAAKTLKGECVCANPTSRELSAISVRPGTTDPAASHASVQALASTMAPATARPASACAELDSKGIRVTSVHPATSATLSANCAGAALLGCCQEAATQAGDVSAGLSLMGLAVISAAWDIIPILVAKLAPVIPGVRWITTVAQLVSAGAILTTPGTPVASVHQASMGTPAAHLASAPQRALSTAHVIRKLDSAAVAPKWLDCAVTPACQGRMDFHTAKWAPVTQQG